MLIVEINLSDNWIDDRLKAAPAVLGEAVISPTRVFGALVGLFRIGKHQQGVTLVANQTADLFLREAALEDNVQLSTHFFDAASCDAERHVSSLREFGRFRPYYGSQPFNVRL